MPALEMGNLYSWSQAQILIAGVPILGIKGISAKKNVEKKNVKGVGSEPIGRIHGGVNYEMASMDIILDSWKQIIAASPNGDPTQLGIFQIRIPFIPNPNFPNQPTTDVMQNCEFCDDGFDYQEGATGFFYKISIIYAGLKRN